MLRACAVSFALISAPASVLAHAPASTDAAPVAAAATTPAAAPAFATYVRPAPPGELVDIGGRRLHIACKGSASGPVVIFEAGLSQFTANDTYGKAQDLIAPMARVCTYDRAGLGWSDPAPGARSHQDMVEDLHKLVAAKHFKGPLVLVGHSMGGLLVRLYEKTYPADVAAIVLVDASPESDIFAPGASDARKAMEDKIDAGLKVAKEGVPVVPMPVGTPPAAMLAFTPVVLRTVRQEYAAIDLGPAALHQPGGYGKLGNLPLVVIRRGKTATPPNDDDRAWQAAQEAMAKLSSRGVLMVAENSGHVIPYEQPQIVADAVAGILADIPHDARTAHAP